MKITVIIVFLCIIILTSTLLVFSYKQNKEQYKDKDKNKTTATTPSIFTSNDCPKAGYSVLNLFPTVKSNDYTAISSSQLTNLGLKSTDNISSLCTNSSYDVYAGNKTYSSSGDSSSCICNNITPVAVSSINLSARKKV
jgi:hypothetical protein